MVNPRKSRSRVTEQSLSVSIDKSFVFKAQFSFTSIDLIGKESNNNLH